MKKMNINNPFYEAPVYYRDVTGSTMDDSKKDASRGIFHGTVYRTSYQESGRGRIRGRNWLSTKAQNLMFTLVLKKSKLNFELNYLPLIAGAALTSAVRDYCGKNFYLKWPNDLIYNGKKCAGILCEADSEYFYCGIGVNCNQVEFPTEISHKTISLKSIVDTDIDLDILNTLILRKFKDFLEKGDEWRKSVESFLYKSGEIIEVLQGQAESENLIKGKNLGIGAHGQLILEQKNGKIVEIYAGEIEL